MGSVRAFAFEEILSPSPHGFNAWASDLNLCSHLYSPLQLPPFLACILLTLARAPELGELSRLARLHVLESSGWGSLGFEGSKEARGEGWFGL